MAMMIYLLREYANEEIDLAKAMMMALIHDIVEIDAGDTYAYDEAALSSQQEREAQAAQRIFGLLPEDQKQEMLALNIRALELGYNYEGE
jgi:putative hydrolase of HD superfamily